MFEMLGTLVPYNTVRVLSLREEQEFYLATVFHHGQRGFHASKGGLAARFVTVKAEDDVVYASEKHLQMWFAN
jgi:hypothetical protein